MSEQKNNVVHYKVRLRLYDQNPFEKFEIKDYY